MTRGQAELLKVAKKKDPPFRIGWKNEEDPAAAAKSLQSCPILCDPIDGNPPGSPILGILQARTLEWVSISSSDAWKWKVKVKTLSVVSDRLLATPWTAAYQTPPSVGLSRQEYWSGLPLPSPEDPEKSSKIIRDAQPIDGGPWVHHDYKEKTTHHHPNPTTFIGLWSK